MNENMKCCVLVLTLVMIVATSVGSSVGYSIYQATSKPILLAQRYPLTNRSANFYARSKTSNVANSTNSNRAKR